LKIGSLHSKWGRQYWYLQSEIICSMVRNHNLKDTAAVRYIWVRRERVICKRRKFRTGNCCVYRGSYPAAAGEILLLKIWG